MEDARPTRPSRILKTVAAHAAAASVEGKHYPPEAQEIASVLHLELQASWSRTQGVRPRVVRRDYRDRAGLGLTPNIEPDSGFMPYCLPGGWDFFITVGTATKWSERGEVRVANAMSRLCMELSRSSGSHLRTVVVVGGTNYNKTHAHALISVDPLSVAMHGIEAIAPRGVRSELAADVELKNLRAELSRRLPFKTDSGQLEELRDKADDTLRSAIYEHLMILHNFSLASRIPM